MIAGRTTLLLARCTRDQSCTMISCVGLVPTILFSVTIFPCTSPTHVHVFYSEEDMVNKNFTRSERARFSRTGTLDIRLMQTEHGVQFEVSFF